jgi:FkbM family methyltransferase
MVDLRCRLETLLQRDLAPLPSLDAREIVIYGAGNCGRSVAAAAQHAGLEVRCFLDARADAKREIDGIACHSPQSEAARGAAQDGIPTVVALFNYATDLQPVFALLAEIGFKRVLSFYEIHALLAMEPQFWLCDRRFYADRQADVLAGLELFDDETSRQVYYDSIALRLTFNTALLAQPDHSNQYFAPDLPPPPVPMRLVDGGAFDGDTLRAIAARGIALEAIAAFEPDLRNFAELCRAAAAVAGNVREMILLPCGLGDATGLQRFSSGSGASSALESSGDTTVQVVALDDVLPNFAPTFVKLDVEGAEPQALKGAAGVISRFRPTLAVCVYHAPEHLWTLPRLIRERWPDYRLALRAHQFNGFDTVAYAFRA